MKKRSGWRKFVILIVLLIVPGLLLVFLSKANHKFSTLPYFGPKIPVASADNDVPDTLYHTVPNFSLLDQDGDPLSWNNFEGNIVVADFFFTSCPTICPIMTKQMTRLQWMMDDPAYDHVKFLSYTVDPETDTPERLRKYGEKNHVDFDRWTFATGDRDKIYTLGTEGYLMSTQVDDDAPGGYLHSGLFVLVDKKRHIRGYYDGTSAKAVDDLATDIRMLIKEEHMKPEEKLPS